MSHAKSLENSCEAGVEVGNDIKNQAAIFQTSKNLGHFGIEVPSVGSGEVGKKFCEVVVETIKPAPWLEYSPNQFLPPRALQIFDIGCSGPGEGKRRRRVEADAKSLGDVGRRNFYAVLVGKEGVAFAHPPRWFDQCSCGIKKDRLDRHVVLPKITRLQQRYHSL